MTYSFNRFTLSQFSNSSDQLQAYTCYDREVAQCSGLNKTLTEVSYGFIRYMCTDGNTLSHVQTHREVKICVRARSTRDAIKDISWSGNPTIVAGSIHSRDTPIQL